MNNTLLNQDILGLPVNTLQVLKKRYLLKDNNKNIVETPNQLFKRVASCVSKAEENFKSKQKRADIEEAFFAMMKNLEFLPNSPTLMNAGTSLGQLSACFVLPVKDSMDGIFNALKNMAKIHQSGGGTGFSFSNLRPKGDLVCSTKGEASGPISFMGAFDKATGVIVQGGRRRGANMGILQCDHPDIAEFIKAKLKEGAFSNFNLSVDATDEFMQAVIKNKKYDLINPRTGRKVKSIKARDIFDLIARCAWQAGDPGLVFLDQINRKNPLIEISRIQATNPCGELPLLPYESCNLGSMNLSKIVNNKRIDWQKLRKLIKLGIRFLDNVLEVNRYPLRQIKEVTLSNRKIGLGVMGFADMLIKLDIAYNADKAIKTAEDIMRFIHKQSQIASVGLAKERGVFSNFKKSIYKKKGLRLRNATLNTVAPTGTISIIANCSSGIEPLFAISYVRNILSGMKLLEINPLFKAAALENGMYSKSLMSEIAATGSVKNIKQIPAELKRIFVTAFDVPPVQHLKIQAAFQKYTDNSVSKTINLPSGCAVNDIKKIYLGAYRLKCKGITVYRYGSKRKQVLSFTKTIKEKPVMVQSEYSGGCAGRLCSF